MAIRQLSMTTIDQDHVRAKFLNGAGQPVGVDGAPQWASSDETVVTVVPDADGLGVLIVAAGLPGTARVTCTADANLDPNVVVPIMGAIDVTIAQSDAVDVDFDFDPTTHKAPTP